MIYLEMSWAISSFGSSRLTPSRSKVTDGQSATFVPKNCLVGIPYDFGGPIAHLVERHICNVEVTGSSPVGSTKIHRDNVEIVGSIPTWSKITGL